MVEQFNVVVARFQVPSLTEGHRYLLEFAREQHRPKSKVVVVLGTTTKPDRKNPLTYEMRRDMLQTQAPWLHMVLPHADMPGKDEAWSAGLDQLLGLVFPNGDINLLCGRDGFKPHYKGKFRVVEVKNKEWYQSGSEVRENVKDDLPNSPSFRQGVIWTVENYFPKEGWKDYGV